MSDPVAASAPSPADISAQRLAEAPIIENEWNNMSYKDRAAWWMSAKWYGYMTTEAYRRGDPANADISCRYGEPGFFIATRVPYYEAQAAVSTIVASVSVTPEPIITTEPAEVPTNVETTTTDTSEEALPVPTPATTTTETAADEAATILREAITNSTSETPATANSQHKKKKKKHHKPATNPGKAPGEGKTIEIRVGGQSK